MSKIPEFNLEITKTTIRILGRRALVEFELELEVDDKWYVCDQYGREYSEEWFKYFADAFDALAWFCEQEDEAEFVISGNHCKLFITCGKDDDGEYIRIDSSAGDQFWSVEDAIVWLFEQEKA